ncbi:MAG: type II toxin-antitoxin system VapC family toxin [Betaproteobacteria bacterium]
MRFVVVDASALAALAFGEPEADTVRDRLEGTVLFAPTLLKFELANTAWKKIRKSPGDADAILGRLETTLNGDWGITWRDVDHVDAAVIARGLDISAYDASYVWLAGSLGADLVTLDQKLIDVTKQFAAQTV